MPSRKMRSGGFTLIELLVVIAVIALLLAVIVPALQNAKRQAQFISCLSSQGSLATAWHMYADDNDSLIVGGHTTLTPYDGWPAFAWVCIPQTEDGASRDSGSTVDEELIGVRRGLLWSYVEAEGTYHCPGDKRHLDPPLVSGGGDGGYRSYSIAGGMNGVDPEGGWWIIPHRQLTTIKSPGDKYVFVEEPDGRGYNMGSWVIDPVSDEWVDPIAIWHNVKGSLGFADGHAERHNWKDKAAIEQAEDQSFYMMDPGGEDIEYMQRSYGYERLL
jgi:prepilin-type N-terminal cleavage/methylation domain-containing protein